MDELELAKTLDLIHFLLEHDALPTVEDQKMIDKVAARVENKNATRSDEKP